jgi:hypothetical protein
LGQVEQADLASKKEPIAAPAAKDPAHTTVSGLTKDEAEELLRWLQANGRTATLIDASHEGYTVRYR